MTRTLHRLTATRVAGRLKPGYYGDGGNLYFRVAPGGTKGWIFRFKMYGRTRDAGLGSYPAVSLARARARAFEYRALVVDGVDPIEQRNAQQAAARVENAKTITFDDCAKAYIAAHADGWRNAKHLQQWRNTLDVYASPVFGKLPVRAIDTGLVMRVLEPMWSEKPETASRLRGRIEIGARAGPRFAAIASARIPHAGGLISILCCRRNPKSARSNITLRFLMPTSASSCMACGSRSASVPALSSS